MKLSLGIPIRVFWDEKFSPDQQSLIRETFSELMKEISAENTQIFYHGNWHAKSFRSDDGNLIPFRSIEWLLGDCWDSKMEQINAEKLTLLLPQFPQGLNSARWTIIFTKRDLLFEGRDYVIGGARTSTGAVISLERLKEINDPDIRKEAQKTEIFHEVGHVFGLPDERRGVDKLDDSLGYHCRETGCSMRQGMNVPEDWIEITQERINLGGKPYCDTCIEDLKEIYSVRANKQ